MTSQIHRHGTLRTYVESSQPDLIPAEVHSWTEPSSGYPLLVDARYNQFFAPSAPQVEGPSGLSAGSAYFALLDYFFGIVSQPPMFIDADDIDAPEPEWITVDLEIVGTIGYETSEIAESDF